VRIAIGEAEKAMPRATFDANIKTNEIWLDESRRGTLRLKTGVEQA